MFEFLDRFRRNEHGAVTIDWAILTALVVGLATAAFAGIEGGVAEATAAIQAFLESIVVNL